MVFTMYTLTQLQQLAAKLGGQAWPATGARGVVVRLGGGLRTYPNAAQAYAALTHLLAMRQNPPALL